MDEVDCKKTKQEKLEQDNNTEKSEKKKLTFNKSYYCIDLLLFILLLTITIPIIIWPYLITVVINIEHVELYQSFQNSTVPFDQYL